MRVAPVGLFFSSDINNKEKAAKYGCEAAAITHGHDMGYLSAGLLSLIIFNIINNKKDSLKDIIVSSNSTMLEIHGDLYIPLFDMICNAIDLTFNDLDDITNISDIGKGWVGDEAIAIAVYCAVKYSKNFKKAIIASVNHSGDSDSTGAITGNIVGCFLGYKNIPKEYLDDLELKIELDEISNDLYDCSYNFEKFINKKNTSQKYLMS
jgi:ADP-ribosylglycohydrolase